MCPCGEHPRVQKQPNRQTFETGYAPASLARIPAPATRPSRFAKDSRIDRLIRVRARAEAFPGVSRKGAVPKVQTILAPLRETRREFARRHRPGVILRARTARTAREVDSRKDARSSSERFDRSTVDRRDRAPGQNRPLRRAERARRDLRVRFERLKGAHARTGRSESAPPRRRHRARSRARLGESSRSTRPEPTRVSARPHPPVARRERAASSRARGREISRRAPSRRERSRGDANPSSERAARAGSGAGAPLRGRARPPRARLHEQVRFHAVPRRRDRAARAFPPPEASPPPRGAWSHCSTTTELLGEEGARIAPRGGAPERANARARAAPRRISPQLDPARVSARLERRRAPFTPRADRVLSPVFSSRRGGATSTSAPVLAAPAADAAARGAIASDVSRVDKVSEGSAVARGAFARLPARQAREPDPPKPQRECVTRPPSFQQRDAKRGSRPFLTSPRPERAQISTQTHRRR